MNQTYEGNFDGRELKIGIVASRFNDFIVAHLVRGAREGLRKCGVPEGSVDLAWVPGSMELAFAAKGMAESGKYDALVCVGCVIRGGDGQGDLPGIRPKRGSGDFFRRHDRHHRAGD